MTHIKHFPGLSPIDRRSTTEAVESEYSSGQFVLASHKTVTVIPLLSKNIVETLYPVFVP